MYEQAAVLVVEDNPDLSLMIETILRFEQIPANRVGEIDKLTESLLSHAPKLLIMDMLLSGHNGADICRGLKRSDKWANLKIMMISAYPDAEKVCKDAGADDFISKPFDMDEFTGKVRRLLGQSS